MESGSKKTASAAGTAGPGPVRRQNRLWLSCSECRARKVKCDRAKPCIRCFKASRVNRCRYDNDGPGVALQTVTSPGQLVFAVEQPINAGQNATHQTTLCSNHTLIGPGQTSQQLTPAAPVAACSPARGPTNTTCAPLQLLWHGSRAVDQYIEPFTGKTVLVPKEVIFGENDATVYWGRSHETNFVPRIMDMTNLLLKSDEDRNEVSILYQVERHTRPKEPISSGALKPHDPDLLCLLPPRKETDRLVGIYVEHFESFYKILHVPTFLDDYARLWDDDPVVSSHGPPHLMAQLLSVCAISSCFGDNHARTLIIRASARRWIDAVRFWLFKQDPRAQMMLGCLQAHLLMLVAGDVHWLKIDRSWISAGILLRNAMSAGLHREPSDFVRVSAFHAELRRRLWYSILEFDLQASFAKGRTPSVRDEDYDCALPSDTDDELLSEDMEDVQVSALRYGNETAGGQGSPVAVPSSLHNLLAKSLPLRAIVCRLINSINLTVEYDEVLRLDAKLKLFLREAAIIVDKDHPMQSFKRVLFDILFRRATIALHAPFAARTLNDPRYLYSRQRCIEMATSILSQALSLLGGHSSTLGPFMTITNICRCEISNSVFLLCHELVTRAVELGRLQSERQGLPPSAFVPARTAHSEEEITLLVELVERTSAALVNISMPGDIVSQRTCAWVQLSVGLSRAAAAALISRGDNEDATAEVASAMKDSIRQSVQAYRTSINQSTHIDHPAPSEPVNPALVDNSENGFRASANAGFENVADEDCFNLFLDMNNMGNFSQWMSDA